MNVEFNNFHWSGLLTESEKWIFRVRACIATNANFNIISCGLGQLLAEPGRTVGGTQSWPSQSRRAGH